MSSRIPAAGPTPSGELRRKMKAVPIDPVLAAAQTLLDEGGSEALTMDRLAERTGLSRATLYRRYGGREAVLQQLAARSGRDPAELVPQDVRARILEATRSELGRVGLSVTVEQIATAAGVGAATVYRHFGSREGLLAAFLASLPPRRRIAAMSAAPDADLAAELTRFATDALGFFSANQDILRLVLQSGDSPELRALRGHDDRSLTMLAAYLGKQMTAGHLRRGDPKQLAAAYLGMLFMFSVVLPALYDQPLGEPAALARALTRLFLEGAGMAKPAATEEPR